MEKLFGQIVDIKIQSISDIITNSSTEVFTIYKRYNIQDIKDLVNALFKLISNLRFDDFFTITLYINEYVIDDLYDSYEELQHQFNSSSELYTYLEGLSDQEIRRYEYMANELSDLHVPFYSGYHVKQKPGVELTPRLIEALQKLNNLDCLFQHEWGETY